MNYIVLLGTAALFHWLPTWRREQQFFAVTVPVAFPESEAGRRVLRNYRVVLWFCTAVAIMVAASTSPWIMAAATGIQLAGAIAAFAWIRHSIVPHATVQSFRTAALFAEPEHIPGGWLALIPPFAVLAVAGFIVATYRQQLPERFPVHWDIAGQPNRWSTRDSLEVFQPLAICAAVLMMMVGFVLAILHGTRQPGGPDADWSRRFRAANLRMLIALMYGICLLYAGMTVMPFFQVNEQLPVMMWVFVGLLLVITVIAAIPLIRMSSEPGSGSDATPDNCWFLGQIYYNPNDPALMVEKRFGIGYTLNFGNRMSWLLMTGIAALPIVMIYLK